MFLGALSLVLVSVEPIPYGMGFYCRGAISALPSTQIGQVVVERSIDQLVQNFSQQVSGDYQPIVSALSLNSVSKLDAYMKAARAFELPSPGETLEALGLDATKAEDRDLAIRFSSELGEILLHPEGYEKLFKKLRDNFKDDQWLALKRFSKFLVRRGLPLGEGDPFLSAQILVDPEAESLRRDFGFTNVPIWGRAQSLKARFARATSSYALTDFALRVHVRYMRGKNSKLFTSIVDAEKATEFNKAIKKVLEDQSVRGYLPSEPSDYHTKAGRYFKTLSQLARSPSDETFKVMYPDIDLNQSLSPDAIEAWNLFRDSPWDKDFFMALSQMARRTLDSLGKTKGDAFKDINPDFSKLTRGQAIEILKYVIPPRDLAAFLEAMDLAWTEHALSQENALKPIDESFDKMNRNFNRYEQIQVEIAKFKAEMERDSRRRALLQQRLKQKESARTLIAKQFVEAYRESLVYARLLKHGMEPRYTYLVETDPIISHENTLYEHRVTDEYNSLELEKIRKRAEEGIVETGSNLARAASMLTSSSPADPMAHLMRAVGEANQVAVRLGRAGFIRENRFASLVYSTLFAFILPITTFGLPAYVAYAKYRDTQTEIPIIVRDGKYLTDETEFNKKLTDIKLRAMHGELSHFEVRDLKRLLESIDEYMLTPEGMRVLEEIKANPLYAELSDGGKYWSSAAEDIEQQVDFIIRTHYMLNLALTADWKKQQSKIYVDYEAYKKAQENESGDETESESESKSPTLEPPASEPEKP